LKKIGISQAEITGHGESKDKAGEKECGQEGKGQWEQGGLPGPWHRGLLDNEGSKKTKTDVLKMAAKIFQGLLNIQKTSQRIFSHIFLYLLSGRLIF
jgi:hypothetical protein